MTPIPKALINSYLDGKPQPFPERPWWHGVHGRFAQRRDGHMLHALTFPSYYSNGTINVYDKIVHTLTGCLPFGVSPPTSADIIDWMAWVDATFPLPHPGFRAGQVWASVCPALTRISVITNHVPKPWDTASLYYVQPAGGPWERRNGSYNREQLIRMLSFDSPEVPAVEGGPTPSRYPYFLLADPTCPHLAPWSSL
jgi:hypothetical protein